MQAGHYQLIQPAPSRFKCIK